MKPPDILRAEDRARIAAAVEAAQGSTAATFALVVVPASDHYAWFPIGWAAIAALVATGALALIEPHWSIAIGFAVDAALFVALTLVFDLWPIRMLLVPERFKRIALYSAAHRAYAAHLMSKDEAHDGVMLFVSLAERHLEIVAERDADAAVPDGTWDRIVADATAAMGRGDVAGGLVGAVEACGKLLAEHFPK
ncbi:MAG TPA: TPM domain-containing protein [Rhizomicrobium sp.]|nr:TPM domain-containing protein [Rhizomicrobium sp.]